MKGLVGKYVKHFDFKETMDKAFTSASVLARAGTRFRRTSSSVKEEFGLSRMRVFAVHGCKCYRCGLEGTEIILTVDNGGGRHVDLYANVKGEYTLMNRDHILPVSKGGQNHLWNLAPACEKCNSNRGNEYTEADTALYQRRLLWKEVVPIHSLVERPDDLPTCGRVGQDQFVEIRFDFL
jgi:5-methylcytosine-specific restriction endonuclease McrA